MEDNKWYQYKDSYLITSTKEKTEIVTRLIEEGKLSTKRSVKSYVMEWHAHNWLYKHGLFVERTKDTDFTANESWFRRLGYWIIWIFTKKQP